LYVDTPSVVLNISRYFCRFNGKTTIKGTDVYRLLLSSQLGKTLLEYYLHLQFNL